MATSSHEGGSDWRLAQTTWWGRSGDRPGEGAAARGKTKGDFVLTVTCIVHPFETGGGTTFDYVTINDHEIVVIEDRTRTTSDERGRCCRFA